MHPTQEEESIYLTQAKTLAALKESGRTGWTPRQTRDLRDEGYLPVLQRHTRPGTNWPIYVWDEKDLEQVVDAYDCWEHCAGDRTTLTLMLWLQGYKVPLERLRQFYEHTVEEYLQRLTDGETDPDNILTEIISKKIMPHFFRKLKHTPSLATQRRRNKENMEQFKALIERTLGVLAVADPEEVINNLLPNTGNASESATNGEAFGQETTDTPYRILAEVHDILTLTHLREVIQEATDDRWEQARVDYLHLCRLFSLLGEFLQSLGCPPFPQFPEQFFINWKLQGAVWLLVPFLSTRHRGYRQELDMTFEKIQDFLTNPELRKV